jgi:hypothetical protein
MARPALRIEVTTKHQKALRKPLSGGAQHVRVVLPAVALLQLAKGVSAPRVAAVVPLTPQAIRKVGHRCQQGGLERAHRRKSLTDLYGVEIGGEIWDRSHRVAPSGFSSRHTTGCLGS